MINIKFLDNSIKQFKKNITVLEIAKDISISLSKKAVGAILDDAYLGLDDPITVDGMITILTKEDIRSLKLLNHSGAHLLAHAVKELYPHAMFWVGPAIENGFYYDIDFGDISISDSELMLIEKKMYEISKKGYKIVRSEVSQEKAREIFKNDIYKLDLIEKYNDRQITIYTQDSFSDLCRGGHIDKLSELKYFKLISLAGAYYKGDSSNKQLTRIYGTAFWDKKSLDDYIQLLQERKDRDHRKIGFKQKLFTLSNEIGQGLPIYLPDGATIRRIIERYIVDKELEQGYLHVYTPIMADYNLYIRSGHWDHYKDSMFPPMEFENKEKLVLRPMNCPHHMVVYNSEIRSYRDLPIRVAELGMMHRYEKSGALSGLSRVREMVLNDAHLFVRPSQIREEFTNVVNLILDCYKDFNITDYKFRLSYHDPMDKEKYFDNEEMWQKAETMLKEAMDNLGLSYVEEKGEAAFYGPKLDVQIKTALGHEETLSTIQLDFLLPERFDLKYVEEDGSINNRPVVIHRGVVSTMERFLAYLIEEYKGVFPLWLSPNQIIVIPVNNDYHLDYSTEIYNILKKNKIRVKLDSRDEKLGYKIREAQTSKINYQLILGDNEKNTNTITYRQYGSQKSYNMKMDEFLNMISKKIEDKSHE